VKASNFAPDGNFTQLLAKQVPHLGKFGIKK
jgi:hypothetical protein